MGLGEVKAAIASQTKEEADAILASAKKEAERILAEARASVQSKKEQHEKTTKELLDAMERKERAAAASAKKTMLLEEKRKAIDAVYSQVQDELANLAGSERGAVLAKLAAKAKSQIDVQRVACASADVPAVSKLFPQASIMADKSMSGGIKATNQDGTVTVDLSFETILESVRDAELEALSQVLFA